MEKLLIILGAVMLVILLALLFALPTMWLWNWLMPKIFGLTTLTFWETFGVMMLCQFMFKSSSSSKS